MESNYRPEYLYKFLQPGRIDVLENGHIRYSQLHDMNDPFDSNPYFYSEMVRVYGRMEVEKRQVQSLLRSGYKYGSEEFREAMMEKAEFEETTGRSDELREWAFDREQSKFNDNARIRMGGHLGALCLTSNGLNQLMWSHYASNHEGFAIKFKPGKKGLSFRGKRESPIGYLSKVKYLDERPIITQENFSQDDMLFAKSRFWEYEDEWRIVRKLKNARKFIKRENLDTICLFDLPIERIESIVVGCRASKDLLEKFIKLLCSAEKYSHISIEGCRMNGYSYDIENVHLFHSTDVWRSIYRDKGEEEGSRLCKEMLGYILPD